MIGRLRAPALLLLTAMGVLLLSQCAKHEAPNVVGVARECPKTSLGILGVPGVGALMRLNPKLVIAESVAPSDTSTSVLVRPDIKQQIRCGRVAIKTLADIVFSSPKLTSGKSLPLAMDVLVPQSANRKPLVVYLPGGGFLRAPKEGALDLRNFVAEAGFVVASIQYRTSTEGATYRESLIDAKSAIRYLRAHAQAYGIDADRVAVWGESAGGYLAAMTGLTNGEHDLDQGEYLDQSSAVQAVIDKFGPSEAAGIAADFDAKTRETALTRASYISLYMGAAAEGQPAPAAANPLTHIDASDPPFLLFHGTQDKLISPSQTLILHNALKAAHVDSTRYVVEGAGHGDLAFLGDAEAALPWSSQETMGILVDFLKRTLGSER
jgi:acetyl esterase/lipase